MNIFEINGAIAGILSGLESFVDPETGEVVEESIDDLIAELDALNMAKEQKLEAMLQVRVQITAELDGILPLMEKLSKRIGSLKKQRERLDNLIEYGTQGEEFRCPAGVIKWTKSTSTEVDEDAFFAWVGDDEDRLRFVNHKETYEPRKADLAKAIKAGETIPGVSRVEHRRIKIT